VVIGLIMGLLKFASLRIVGEMESEFTWWESYGIYTVVGLLTIAIHGALRRFFSFSAGSDDDISSSQGGMDAEYYEEKR
jgi:hypothetical protein